MKFQLSYERYLRQIDQINENSRASRHIVPTGYKACVSPELLLSLITMRAFPSCATTEQVTDEHVKEWLQVRSRCAVNDTKGHVKEALARVHFKNDRSDPDGAAMQFFADVLMELRRNRVSHVIEEASKTLIQDLTKKLEPVALRESISSAYEYWPEDTKNNFHHLWRKSSKERQNVRNTLKWDTEMGIVDHQKNLIVPKISRSLSENIEAIQGNQKNLQPEAARREISGMMSAPSLNLEEKSGTVSGQTNASIRIAVRHTLFTNVPTLARSLRLNCWMSIVRRSGVKS